MTAALNVREIAASLASPAILNIREIGAQRTEGAALNIREITASAPSTTAIGVSAPDDFVSDPFTPIHLLAEVAGTPDAVTWTQTSGPKVAFVQTGLAIDFIAPAVMDVGPNLVFLVTAVKGGELPVTADTRIQVKAHCGLWFASSTHVWLPTQTLFTTVGDSSALGGADLGALDLGA